MGSERCRHPRVHPRSSARRLTTLGCRSPPWWRCPEARAVAVASKLEVGKTHGLGSTRSPHGARAWLEGNSITTMRPVTDRFLGHLQLGREDPTLDYLHP